MTTRKEKWLEKLVGERKSQYRQARKRSKTVRAFEDLDFDRFIPDLDDFDLTCDYLWHHRGIIWKWFISFPWDRNMADEILKRFTNLGWVIEREIDHKSERGEYTFILEHEEVDILTVTVEMDATLRNSKCELITVGWTEPKSDPIYEIRCNDDTV